MPRMGKKKRATRTRAGRKMRTAAALVQDAGQISRRRDADATDRRYLRHTKEYYDNARAEYHKAGGTKGRKSAAKSARRKAGTGGGGGGTAGFKAFTRTWGI